MINNFYCDFIKCKYAGRLYCENLELVKNIGFGKINIDDFLNNKIPLWLYCPHYKKINILLKINPNGFVL